MPSTLTALTPSRNISQNSSTSVPGRDLNLVPLSEVTKSHFLILGLRKPSDIFPSVQAEFVFCNLNLPLCNLLNLMLTATVERRPLDRRSTFTAPIVTNPSTTVTDDQVPTLKRRREADGKGTNVACGSGNIDVDTEQTRRASRSIQTISAIDDLFQTISIH